MMQITHAATAAALGTQTENIYLAFIGAVLIHFLIDKIPHYWTTSQKEKNIILVFDYALTIIFIGALFYGGLLSASVIAALLGALLTDIILVGIPPIFKGKLGRWHTNRQPHLSDLKNLYTDAAVILVSFFIIYLATTTNWSLI